MVSKLDLFSLNVSSVSYSDYSDIYIKDENFENLDNNKIGLIHLLSTIPKSYLGTQF